jgi:hypothetical protein
MATKVMDQALKKRYAAAPISAPTSISVNPTVITPRRADVRPVLRTQGQHDSILRKDKRAAA